MCILYDYLLFLIFVLTIPRYFYQNYLIIIFIQVICRSNLPKFSRMFFYPNELIIYFFQVNLNLLIFVIIQFSHITQTEI